MRASNWCAAVFAALFIPTLAMAQDVSLSSRDGALVIDGTLQGFDGEFYRVATQYGLLTIDGQGVVCDGPGCPDLTAPMATLRITGAEAPGLALLPGLLSAFAASRGLDLTRTPQDGGLAVEMTEPETGKPVARISFAPLPPDAARNALISARADLMVAAHAEAGLGQRVMALEALVPVVAPDNALAQVSTADLARILAGEVQNWAEVGGPDMPVAVHAMNEDTSEGRALTARLGRAVKADVRHDTPADLAGAVARDPYAVALMGRSATGAARVLPLTDSCGYPLEPTALAVKAEDYPLTLSLSLLTPRRRLPLFARDFLDFLALPEAQAAIATAGLIDRAPERRPLTADGLRLINAIRGAGDEVGLDQLKRLVDAMAGAERLSFTFRFEDGSSTLDAHSRENLTDLARLLGIGAFVGQDMILAGFSDGSGAASANLELSQARAEAVAKALAEAVGDDLPEGQGLPGAMAFGEALPMACDATSGGRRINRRVELWLRPAGAKGSPAP